MNKSALRPGALGTGLDGGSNAGALSLVKPELVQKHLEQVLTSSEMCRSKQLCQFLRFTVEEVLRGHGSELKEYAIAVGVFRRGREFDPGADPIVRVQTRRLRAKLARYYQIEGRGEPIQIEYPVGGYSPIFVRRSPSVNGAKPALGAIPASAGEVPRRIAVLPFADVGPEESQTFSDGLTDELIHSLSSWPGFRVVARTSCLQFKSKPEDVRQIGEWLGVCALVSGTVRREGSNLRVLVQLIDTETGLNLASAGGQWELGGILETQQKISREVAEIVKAQLTSWGSLDSRAGDGE
jgi:TolB-like protein